MEEGIGREFGMDMYTLLCLKWITNRDLLYSTGALLSVMWQPGWEEVWRSMGTCMAESLHCSPETITTLLISYERESHSIVSDSL